MNEYSQALEYLLSLPDWERGTGERERRSELLLERPSALVFELGAPQKRFRSVIVAGTKGKGSMAAMLAEILRASGLQVGLYSSPHLHTYRERVRVNAEMISEEAFAREVHEIRTVVEHLTASHPEYGTFTTFEVMTVLALCHFAREKVDVAILEVGMGGRLDATNVVDADLSLITPVSFDHMDVLGNTLPMIAAEKAGIIKESRVVLSAPQPSEALVVIEKTARSKNAVLAVGERDWIWLGGHDDFMVAGEPHSGLWSSYWNYRDLALPLLGPHQFVNASLAVAAAHTIWENWRQEKGGPGTGDQEIGEKAIQVGFKQVEWPGRLEVLQERSGEQPLVVADGAHNGDSAEKLLEALRFHFEFDKLFLIVGVLGDKDFEAITRPFVDTVEFAWAVKPAHPRGRSAESAAWVLNGLGMRASATGSFAEALSLARGRAGARDLILISGSLALVAQAREAFGLVQEKDSDA